jgi:hypothetical protein
MKDATAQLPLHTFEAKLFLFNQPTRGHGFDNSECTGFVIWSGIGPEPVYKKEDPLKNYLYFINSS